MEVNAIMIEYIIPLNYIQELAHMSDDNKSGVYALEIDFQDEPM